MTPRRIRPEFQLFIPLMPVVAVLIGFSSLRITGLSAQAPAPPPWAYTVNPPPAPGVKPAPPDPAPQQVPGSTASLTVAQTRDAFNPPDWHPSGHPPMPESVAHGRRPEMRACGFCHLVNGQGRPENASLAGLPAAYIVQQMADFKNGDRKSAEPRMGPPNAMIQDAKAANDEEIRTAAAYFASFPFKKWIRVVEAVDVPKTRIAGSMHVPAGDGTEPLGQRIIELPEDLRRTEFVPDGIACEPEGPIKPDEWWRLGWIPFCGDGGGNHLCVDVDPARGGNPGQVISMWHDDGARALIARSLTDFIEILARDAESGAIAWDAAWGGVQAGPDT